MNEEEKHKCRRIAEEKYRLATGYMTQANEFIGFANKQIQEANDIMERLNNLGKRPKLRLVNVE